MRRSRNNGNAAAAAAGADRRPPRGGLGSGDDGDGSAFGSGNVAASRSTVDECIFSRLLGRLLGDAADDDGDGWEAEEDGAPFLSDAEQAGHFRARYGMMMTLAFSLTTKISAFYYFHLSSLDPPGSFMRGVHAQAAKVAAALAVFVVICFPFHRPRCVRARRSHHHRRRRCPQGHSPAALLRSPVRCGSCLERSKSQEVVSPPPPSVCFPPSPFRSSE